jgi:hypothetical protein
LTRGIGCQTQVPRVEVFLGPTSDGPAFLRVRFLPHFSPLEKPEKNFSGRKNFFTLKNCFQGEEIFSG